MTAEQIEVYAATAAGWLIKTHLPEMDKYVLEFSVQDFAKLVATSPAVEAIAARKLDEGDEIHLPVGTRVLKMPKGQAKRPGLASSQRVTLKKEAVGTLTSWSLFDREMELTMQTEDGTRLIAAVGFDQPVIRTKRS